MRFGRGTPILTHAPCLQLLNTKLAERAQTKSSDKAQSKSKAKSKAKAGAGSSSDLGALAGQVVTIDTHPRLPIIWYRPSQLTPVPYMKVSAAMLPLTALLHRS